MMWSRLSSRANQTVTRIQTEQLAATMTQDQSQHDQSTFLHNVNLEDETLSYFAGWIACLGLGHLKNWKTRGAVNKPVPKEVMGGHVGDHSQIRFPSLYSLETAQRQGWCFVRGCVESSCSVDGTLKAPPNDATSSHIFNSSGSCSSTAFPQCRILSASPLFLEDIAKFTNVTWSDARDSGMKTQKAENEPEKHLFEMVATGVNALDLLAKMYDGFSAPLMEELRRHYIAWASYVPGLQLNQFSKEANLGRLVRCQWVKSHPNAVTPLKLRASDIGYDMTIVEKIKQVGPLSYYDTGIKLIPEFGWYVEIVPRSSLPKSGHMLANSIGIIDRAYTGNIIVALFKVDPDAPDIELPFRAVQAILRPTVHYEMQQTETLESTERGDKGFGSSGTV